MSDPDQNKNKSTSNNGICETWTNLVTFSMSLSKNVSQLTLGFLDIYIQCVLYE